MYIRAISSALPSVCVDAHTIHRWCGSDVAFQHKKLGIYERCLLGETETGLTLAYEACTRLFAENAALVPANVQLLAFVTQNPEYGIPHNAALLQDMLGLSATTACFDIGLGCSGYVYGLATLKALMLSERFENAILVTCDPYSKIVDRQDKDTASIFGDAATATWLSAAKGAVVGYTDFGTDGSGGKHLCITHGQHDKSFGRKLHMNGRAIFNFMMQRIEPSLQSCCEKNTVSFDEIDFFVFHQASAFLLQVLGEKLFLPKEKVPLGLSHVGNTVSSSIPLVLRNMMRQKTVLGKKVCICGFGVGLSWATGLLTFPEDMS